VITKTPTKVLDAPGIMDDYYLNLVDWSSQNSLVVGLGSSVYTWNAASAKVNKLYDLGAEDSVSSVNWSKNGSQLAVGLDSGRVQIWDVEA
jgi:cell division cycle 20-like protein 1 (cofactor of APC complex)